MDPKKPQRKSSLSKVLMKNSLLSMITKIIRFVMRITLKVILIASKPILSEVKCLIKRPLKVKEIGVMKPPRTAAQTGTLPARALCTYVTESSWSREIITVLAMIAKIPIQW
jgi:hypothetical protein